MTHTPGPWKVEVERSFCGDTKYTVRVCGNYQGAYGDDLFAVTSIFHGGRVMPEEEYLANAAICAASPDLLHACQVALEGLRRLARLLPDDEEEVNEGGYAHRAMGSCVAAIAAAGGNQL